MRLSDALKKIAELEYECTELFQWVLDTKLPSGHPERDLRVTAYKEKQEEIQNLRLRIDNGDIKAEKFELNR